MKIKNLYKSYIEDTGGNFAMMFGVMSVPILIATGMAIDISRIQSFDQKLQDAVDAAAIYGTVIPENSGNNGGNGGGGNGDDNDDDDDDLGSVSNGGGNGNGNGNGGSFDDRVLEHLKTNLNVEGSEIEYFKVTPFEDGSVAVTARASIPAMFAQINGFPRMTTLATTDADADLGSDLEVVIAFDTTNSMGFDNTWTAAMGTLNNVLNELDQYTGANNFYVTLVPFSDRVNIGTTNDDWLSGSAPVNWAGCVEPREVDNGTVSWALDAEKPNGANKFDASIVGVTGGLAARGGGYPFCPSVSITGPTNNVSEIITAANAFTKSGTGRFDVGMAWAWRVLAKNWRTEWPNMHNSFALDKERRQVAIMVTDGRTNAYDYEVNQANTWAYNEGSIEGFENMVAVCDGMKAENVELFMVRVNGNDHATSYMQDCASSEQHYYEISSNADLELTFEKVLKVVKSNVRLTQ